MSRFKRGDRVVANHPQNQSYGDRGTVIGPEDFEGYERNQPSAKWVLVEWDDDSTIVVEYGRRRTWNGEQWLKLEKEEASND